MRILPRRVALLSLALITVAATGACTARRRIPPGGGAPQTAPKQAGAYEPPVPAPPADLSLHVAQLAAGQQVGAGRVDALVFGNVALVAVPDVGRGNPRGPLNAPADLAGRRGGGTNPGLTTRGNTPTSTPGAPGFTLSPTGGGGAFTGTQPGAAGTEMDRLSRLSDHIRSRLPQIVEVRFLTDPAEAARLRAIADELRAGRSIAPHATEVAMLLGRSIEAGTVVMPAGPPLPGHVPNPGTIRGSHTGHPPGQP